MIETQRKFESDNRTGINHEGPDANKPVQRLTAKSIITDKIENPEGENLGHIEDLMINLRTGKIEYAVLEFGAFLGIGGKLFAIPFSELELNPVKKTFLLNRRKEYLEAAPGFDKTHWPDTNLHSYFEDVDSYFETPRAYPL